MKSRIGFEQLEASFPSGELAPVTVLIENKGGFTFTEKELKALESLNEKLLKIDGISSTTLPERDVIKRLMLVPAIVTLLKQWNWWPSKNYSRNSIFFHYPK